MQIFVFLFVYTLGIGIIVMWLKGTAEEFSLWLKAHTSKERERLRNELREELYLEAVKKIYDKEASHLDKISKQDKTIYDLGKKIETLQRENEQYANKIKSYLIMSDIKLSDLVNNWRFKHVAELMQDSKLLDDKYKY